MKLNRNEKYVKWGLTAFLVIVAAGLFWLVFSNLRGFYDLIVEFLNIISDCSPSFVCVACNISPEI